MLLASRNMHGRQSLEQNRSYFYLPSTPLLMFQVLQLYVFKICIFCLRWAVVRANSIWLRQALQVGCIISLSEINHFCWYADCVSQIDQFQNTWYLSPHFTLLLAGDKPFNKRNDAELHILYWLHYTRENVRCWTWFWMLHLINIKCTCCTIAS